MAALADRVPVLVTGGAGYIGSHAVLALRDAGWPVAVVDDLSTGFRWAVPDGVPFYQGDVGEEDLLARIFEEQQIRAVMHFAGSIVVPESVRDPLGYYLNNTVKSRALIAACVARGVPHIIFSSTAAVYGLPEFYRDELVDASLIATPGCYVTAAILAVRPLVDAGLISNDTVIVDAASGVTGAGRKEDLAYSFTTVDENFTAYGLLHHRHTPEMEQEIGARVLFTPHLLPMNRGILATCYSSPASDATRSPEAVLATLRAQYADEPFVKVIEGIPGTKATLGSNLALVTGRYDERTDTIITISAIDNLTKGASGGAVQALNVALGIDEASGLDRIGVAP